MFSCCFRTRVASLRKRLFLSSASLRSRTASLASCRCLKSDLSWNGSPGTVVKEFRVEKEPPFSLDEIEPRLASAVGEGVICCRLLRLLAEEDDGDDDDDIVQFY